MQTSLSSTQLCFLQCPQLCMRRWRASRSEAAFHRRRAIRVVACLSKSFPASVGVAHDKEMDAVVLVVGCVHGASASARDVRMVIEQARPDAVVLELCQPRFNGLLQSMKDKILPTNIVGDNMCNENLDLKRQPFQSEKRSKGRLNSFKRMVRSFGGVGPASVAFALNGVYGIQRRAGVDPGVEFKVAIIAAGEQSQQCRVVCGDALATDIVRAIFRGLSQPLRAVIRAPGAMWSAIRRLLVVPKGSINIFHALVENKCARIREFVGILAPAVVAMYVIVFFSSLGSVYLRTTLFGCAISGPNVVDHSFGTFYRLLVGAIDVGNFAILAYLAVSVLTLFDVLIETRDILLAKSVSNTIYNICKERKHIQSSTHSSSSNAVKKGIVVVVVVGLLHVNGILRYLSKSGEMEQ